MRGLLERYMLWINIYDMNKILENFPHCNEFNKYSFVSVWHERAQLDISKYWEFEKDIFELSKGQNSDNIPREVAWPITRIFSFIMMSIQSHYNPNDLFSLTMDHDIELHNFRERFQCVVEGFFSGNMPDNENFEIINPLL